MKNNIPTPHIKCNDQDAIAKTVLMPGDPLRAKYIAEAYLDNVTMFNQTRNMFGYTGFYKGKKVSVMGSGMGMPSIGIYSYELFNNYDVDNIIRIGTAGSYSKDIKIFDTCLITSAYTDSNYAKVAANSSMHIIKSSYNLNSKLKKSAKKQNIKLIETRCHSTDVFYNTYNPTFSYDYLRDKKGCKCVEMESFALFLNASLLNKNAACLLTISDSFISGAKMSQEDREKHLNDMIKIALEAIE